MSNESGVPSQVVLFDRDRVEQLDGLADRPRRLSRSRLLWVDLDRQSEEAVRRVAREFALDDETRDALVNSKERARFHDHGHYIQVTAYAPGQEDDCALVALECIVGENWVITAHDEPISVLDEFAARASGSGDTGSMDGPTFLAALLEWVLGAYADAFERIEQRLERFDVNAMRGKADAEREIERLVEMRLEVGRLRRALSAHRPTLVALTYPELEPLGDGDSAKRFESLLEPV